MPSRDINSAWAVLNSSKRVFIQLGPVPWLFNTREEARDKAREMEEEFGDRYSVRRIDFSP